MRNPRDRAGTVEIKEIVTWYGNIKHTKEDIIGGNKGNFTVNESNSNLFEDICLKFIILHKKTL